MRHYRVRDVMTAEPVTVNPATPLKEVADLLVRQKVGALPVVTLTGRVVGLVTEAELLRKEQIEQDPEGQRWMHLSNRARRAIVTAETAMEIMNMHPVTIRATATVVEAARLMDLQQISCLLVTGHDGKLLGMATARDLLRIMLRSDEDIRKEISHEVFGGYLGTNPALVQIDVTGGVVRLSGEVERRSMLATVLPAIRAVDGVIDVEGTLGYAVDDTSLHVIPAREEPELTSTGHSPIVARRMC